MLVFHMSCISKSFVSILILIMAMSSLSLLTVIPANAQTTPALSIPQFTVSFVNRSYTTPIITTQTTDPFTGQQVTHTSGGQYVNNETIDIKIQNPPYRSATLPNGTVGQLFYSVRTKGHFADWTPVSTSGYSFTQVFPSTSDYTVVTLIIASDASLTDGNVYIQLGGQEDFQVEANIGYQYELYQGIVPMGKTFASYADSGWSDIQTITIPTSSTSVIAQSPTPTSTPMSTAAVPELSWLAVIPMLIAVLFASLMLRHRKITKTTDLLNVTFGFHRFLDQRSPIRLFSFTNKFSFLRRSLSLKSHVRSQKVIVNL